MDNRENTNYYKILPFHNVTDYDIECEYISTKRKLLNIMDNEKFNEFFTNIGPTLASQITSSTDFSSYLTDNYPHSIFFRPIVEADIVREINRMDPGKAMAKRQI